MDDGDVCGNSGKIERFFHRRIAAADYDDVLASEKEAVASRAGRNPKTLERLLSGKSEPLGFGARGENDALRLDDAAGVAGDTEG